MMPVVHDRQGQGSSVLSPRRGARPALVVGLSCLIVFMGTAALAAGQDTTATPPDKPAYAWVEAATPPSTWKQIESGHLVFTVGNGSKSKQVPASVAGISWPTPSGPAPPEVHPKETTLQKFEVGYFQVRPPSGATP